MRAHVLDPACALLVVSKGQSIEAFTDRLDPAKLNILRSKLRIPYAPNY